MFGLADDGFKVIELLEVELAERHQLRVVVNRRIVKAIANRSHHEDVLQAAHHLIHLELPRLAALKGDDRTEVQEFAERAPSLGFLVLILRDALRKLRRLRDHRERTVRREVEDIALLLDLAALDPRRLDAEDRLHVRGRGSMDAARDHQHSSPFGNRHAGRQLAARQRDRARMLPDRRADQFQRIVLVLLLVIIPLSRDICHTERLVEGMVVDHLAERLCRGNAGNHPEGMAEVVAVFRRGERIAARRGRLGEKIKEPPDILGMNEVAHLHALRHRSSIRIPVAGPRAEELGEVERLSLKLLLGIAAEVSRKVEGIDVHPRENGIRIRLVRMLLVPSRLGRLLLHIIPLEDGSVVKARQQIERRTRKRKDFGLLVALDQLVGHLLAKLGLCPLVRLIDDDEIPRRVKDRVVLEEVTANALRAAKILNGREVDEMLARLVVLLEDVLLVGLFLRLISLGDDLGLVHV